MREIAKYIRENKLKTKLIAITAASNTKIPGTGAFIDGDYKTPFIIEAFEKNYFDQIIEVDYHEVVENMDELKQYGLYVGLQSVGVYTGYKKVASQFDKNEKIVLISGDRGWKNTDKI